MDSRCLTCSTTHFCNPCRCLSCLSISMSCLLRIFFFAMIDILTHGLLIIFCLFVCFHLNSVTIFFWLLLIAIIILKNKYCPLCLCSCWSFPTSHYKNIRLILHAHLCYYLWGAFCDFANSFLAYLLRFPINFFGFLNGFFNCWLVFSQVRYLRTGRKKLTRPKQKGYDVLLGKRDA